MSAQKCERCRQEEYIPTHQYVKFEDNVHYLCQACWERFKEWFRKECRHYETSNNS